MKLLGALLVTLSLAFGAIVSTTAYLPSTGLADEKLIPGPDQHLTIFDNYEVVNEDGETILIAERDDPLDAEKLQALRDAGVERVRVKEFAFSRWGHAMYFPIAVVGLVLGGFIMRSEARKAAAADPADTTRATPASALDSMIEIVAGLHTDLPGISSEEARLHEIVHRLDEIQRLHALVVVDNRATLMARMGMARFAQFMDVYSTAERRINRAWSAAADGVHDEALACLNEAPELLEGAREMLQ